MYSYNGNDVFVPVVGGKLLYHYGDFIINNQDELLEEKDILHKQLEHEGAKLQETRR